MADQVPPTMSGLAITIDRSSVTFLTDLPTPPFFSPNNDPHQYLIKVKAAAITMDELLWRGSSAGEARRHVPAHDVYGTVIAVQRNPNIPHQPVYDPLYAIGDQVFGFLHPQRDGAAAEYTIAYESEITLIANLSPADAASLPWAALAAWQALFVYAHPVKEPVAGSTLADGTVVLVTGATSAAGTAAVQIARWAGAQGVIAVVDDPSVDGDFLKGLGASEVLATADFDTVIKTREDAGEFWPVTVVLDTVGPPLVSRTISMVQKRATVLSTRGFNFHSDEPIPAEPKKVLVNPSPSSDDLSWISRLVDIQFLKPFVGEVLPLEEGVKAFDDLKNGSFSGRKIVLDVVGNATVVPR